MILLPWNNRRVWCCIFLDSFSVFWLLQELINPLCWYSIIMRSSEVPYAGNCAPARWRKVKFHFLHLFYLQIQSTEGERVDSAELKAFVQAHVPQARLKEAQGNDLVYSLPPFNSSNASSYRSLLSALDSNLDALQLGGYGISDTTLEEVRAHWGTVKGSVVTVPAIQSITLTRSRSYTVKRLWQIQMLFFICAGVPAADTITQRTRTRGRPHVYIRDGFRHHIHRQLLVRQQRKWWQDQWVHTASLSRSCCLVLKSCQADETFEGEKSKNRETHSGRS